MFKICSDNINHVWSIIEKKGPLYTDLNSAAKIFFENGKIEGDEQEVKEFNSIMEFLFLCRKPRENSQFKNDDDYISYDYHPAEKDK